MPQPGSTLFLALTHTVLVPSRLRLSRLFRFPPLQNLQCRPLADTGMPTASPTTKPTDSSAPVADPTPAPADTDKSDGPYPY